MLGCRVDAVICHDLSTVAKIHDEFRYSGAVYLCSAGGMMNEINRSLDTKAIGNGSGRSHHWRGTDGRGYSKEVGRMRHACGRA